MSDTNRRRAYWALAVVILAALPAAYLFFSGQQLRTALEADLASATAQAEALRDSLDGARTQLLLDAAMARVRLGDFEEARSLASEFFARVDERSRLPGAVAGPTDARMRILALRDRAITELSRQTAEGPRLLEELATLHLGVADPALHARSPLGLPVPEGKKDTTGTVR